MGQRDKKTLKGPRISTEKMRQRDRKTLQGLRISTGTSGPMSCRARPTARGFAPCGRVCRRPRRHLGEIEKEKRPRELRQFADSFQINEPRPSPLILLQACTWSGHGCTCRPVVLILRILFVFAVFALMMAASSSTNPQKSSPLNFPFFSLNLTTSHQPWPMIVTKYCLGGFGGSRQDPTRSINPRGLIARHV
jgi:hypothetical protein